MQPDKKDCPSNNLASSKKTALSFREKLCYGIGDISNGLALSSISVWYLYFLTDVVGMLVIFASAAMMVGRLWDAITDPIMGWMTDHTKSRWGKRLPYLLFGAIPYAISYLALWSIPEFEKQSHLFIYVTLALILFNTCLTVIFVPYTSLTASITTDYNERTSITGYRMFCSQIAFLLGATAIPLLVGKFKNVDPQSFFHSMFGSWAGTAREGHLVVAAIFSLIMIAAIWTTVWGVEERDADEPSDPKEPVSNSPFSYASSIISELRGNRPFLISVLILLFSNCAATFQAANLAYYLEYILFMKSDRTAIMATLFLAAILSVPVWVYLVKRFGKAETFRTTMVFYAFVLCSMPLITPAIGALIYPIAAVLGVFYASALTIPWTIVPDVVEYDELKRGGRREGLFYGGTTFSYKAATGIAILLSGVVLKSAGYAPNVVQTPIAANAIKFLIGPAPALFLIAAAVLALKYPLTAEKHQQILAALSERKEN